MKYLEVIGAVLQAVLFILSYRYGVAKEKREDAKALSVEADQAIREGRFDDVIVIWSRMRQL